MTLLFVSPVTFGILAIGFIAFLLFPKKKGIPSGTKKLPGPKGIPILGSVPEVPAKHGWLQFHTWSKTYGPICQVKLASDTVVLISSPKIAEDLLVKRQAIYSSRAHFAAIAGDNATDMHYLPLMQNGADHARGKLFAKKLMSSIPKAHLADVTATRTKVLILDLLKDPLDFRHLLERCTAGISSTIAWGNPDPEVAKETVIRAEELLEGISPESIENKLPFLESIPSWIPGFLQPWRVNELRRAKQERAFWFGQREKCQSLIAEKPASSTYSWTKESMKDMSVNDEEKAYTIGMLSLIGGMLESAPIQGWCIAMCFFPEWQAKGQAEVDAVCGDRMPSVADIQKLPIVRALIRETFRWRPPVPFGVPHELEQDDIYEGYHLAKGSLVFALEWAMMRDETLYPDPEDFKPERWLDPAYPTFREPLTQHPSVKAHSGFGWGRRLCVGMDYSESVIVTIVASILWSCTISKQIDAKTGKTIEPPWLDYGPFVIVRPEACPLDIKPRDGQRIELLSL